MIKDDRPPNRVLVELDALLDTRLGTLSRINEEAAAAALQDERYFGRLIDDFIEICGVDRATFLDAYRQRDVATLEASTITEMPFILAELTMKLEADIIDTPFASEVIVDLNCYPYQLDDEEREIIAQAVGSRLGEMTKVQCIYRSHAELSPQYIKPRYSGVILYNLRDWMEANLENFKKVTMPRVTVLAPALHHDKIPNPDEFSRDGLNKELNIFQLTELATVELFSLSLLPPLHYCIARVPGVHVPPVERKPT